MIATLLIAWCLLAVTVAIHAAGLSAMLPHVLSAVPDRRFWPVTWEILWVAWRLILLHLTEIAAWALFYWWKCLPDAESSFYFSGVTYATLGYGDLVLPEENSEEFKSLARRLGYRDQDRSQAAARLAVDIRSWMKEVHNYFVSRFASAL